jgi:hypothetical protein
VIWKDPPWRVIAPFVLERSTILCLRRVELFGNAALIGGKFHLKLNMEERPIANKYREGKMKRTLKKE